MSIKLKWKRISVGGAAWITLILLQTAIRLTSAQSLVTATPVPISLPTQTVPVIEQEITPTFTPTPEIQGGATTGVTLEARVDSGAVNVRADPDPDAAILGTISAGTTYPVTGRYFRWLQFRYERSGSGLGWVFDGLVELVGDPAAIPEIDPFAIPTADPLIVNATQTASVITLTPGAPQTLAAISGTPLATQESGFPGSGGQASDAMPTFTVPPELVGMLPPATQNAPLENATATPAAVTNTAAASSQRLAPIIPIVILGGLGLLGLGISALRR